VTGLARRTTADQVAREIRRRIWHGELRGGDRLTQEDLAVTLDVSRIPVREALIALAAEGTVRMAPHRGASVEPLTAAGVEDHYELFGHVDGFALRRAVERADVADRAELAADLRAAAAIDDPGDMARLVISSRQRVHEWGGSPRFAAVARGLTGLVVGNFFVEVPGALAVAQRRLPEVGAAIEAADIDRAVDRYAAMMREHGALVLEVLRDREVLS